MNGYNVLKYGATGIAAPDMTFYDRLRAEKTTAGLPVTTITGIPPLSFRADGRPLISWSMLGNGQQNGTPSPDNIVMPTFCGKLVGADWTIPITSAGQTQTTYLGQVQTARRVRKLVLDGTEEWLIATQSGHNVAVLRLDPIGIDSSFLHKYGICTHYPVAYNNNDGYARILNNGNNLRIMDDLRAVDKTTWTAFLAAQYAARTPVTVWYVLATPETGIVNEPLAKIGDYADELHSEDAGITIPTIRGSNVLSVGTDLQPSSVSITGHIKPST